MRALHYAVRRLRATLTFSCFVVLTLAISIGSTTAVVSVVYAVAFQPPEVDEVEQVVSLYHSTGGSGPAISFSWPDFDDLKRHQGSFNGTAAWAGFSSAVALPSGGKSIQGELVDGDYFQVLRVTPLLGRLIQRSDDALDAPAVVVLGARFWEANFDSNPNAVGSVIRIGGQRFTVIGVAPLSTRGLAVPTLAPAAAWIPIRQRHRLALGQTDPLENDRDRRWVRGVARLAQEDSLDRANLDLRRIGGMLDASTPIGRGLAPQFRSPSSTQRLWFARPLSDVRIHESIENLVTPVIATIFLAMTLVVLVACTNLAHLFLARALSRQHELAIRRALGASRAQVILDQVADYSLLALLGGLLGVMTSRVLLVAFSVDFAVGDNPAMVASIRPELNLWSVMVAVGTTVFSIAVSGFVPAWYSTQGNLWSAASRGGTLSGGLRWGGRRALISVQVMVCVAILVLATVSAGKAMQIGGATSGLDLDSLAFVTTDPSASSIVMSRAAAALELAAERVRLLPGVTGSAISTALPIGPGETSVAIATVGSAFGAQTLRPIEASSDILSVLGWPLLRGRGLTPDDQRYARAVALLTESAAERVFGQTDVVGQVIRYRRPRELGKPAPPEALATVVGIIGDVHDSGTSGPQRGVLVLPLGPETPNRRLMLLANSRAPVDTADHLRAAIVEAEEDLTISSVGTGRSMLDGFTQLLRVIAATASFLAAFTLVLVLLGVHGVLSFVVSRRRHEIGVRLALGAAPTAIRRMMLWDGLWPVIWGIAAGGLLVAPVLLSPLGRAILRVDAASLGLTLLAPPILILTACAAIWLPAESASKIDPSRALRDM